MPQHDGTAGSTNERRSSPTSPTVDDLSNSVHETPTMSRASSSSTPTVSSTEIATISVGGLLWSSGEQQSSIAISTSTMPTILSVQDLVTGGGATYSNHDGAIDSELGQCVDEWEPEWVKSIDMCGRQQRGGGVSIQYLYRMDNSIYYRLPPISIHRPIITFIHTAIIHKGSQMKVLSSSTLYY